MYINKLLSNSNIDYAFPLLMTSIPYDHYHTKCDY